MKHHRCHFFLIIKKSIKSFVAASYKLICKLKYKLMMKSVRRFEKYLSKKCNNFCAENDQTFCNKCLRHKEQLKMKWFNDRVKNLNYFKNCRWKLNETKLLETARMMLFIWNNQNYHKKIILLYAKIHLSLLKVSNSLGVTLIRRFNVPCKHMRINPNQKQNKINSNHIQS